MVMRMILSLRKPRHIRRAAWILDDVCDVGSLRSCLQDAGTGNFREAEQNPKHEAFLLLPSHLAIDKADLGRRRYETSRTGCLGWWRSELGFWLCRDDTKCEGIFRPFQLASGHRLQEAGLHRLDIFPGFSLLQPQAGGLPTALHGRRRFRTLFMASAASCPPPGQGRTGDQFHFLLRLGARRGADRVAGLILTGLVASPA